MAQAFPAGGKTSRGQTARWQAEQEVAKVIQHYPQDCGGREWRKDVTRTARRTDDRRVGTEHTPSLPGKKDRHRWCRGKVGIEHQPEWVLWFAVTHNKPGAWWREVCSECGKKLKLVFRADD